MSIAFIGAGKMAEAIISVALDADLYEPWEVIACDISAERLDYLAEAFEVTVTADPLEAVANAITIVLAVKPQELTPLLRQIKPKLAKQHLIISIAAGKTLATIHRSIGDKPRLIRVMPNLPVMVQEGMTAYCADATAKPEDHNLVREIFGNAGAVLELPERNFHAVTALSGSGPAFAACFMQAMTAAATALKLPPEAAELMASQTLLGTALYLQSTNQPLDEFIAAVASPGGTTAAGLDVLQNSDFSEIIANTLKAAARRSSELR